MREKLLRASKILIANIILISCNNPEKEVADTKHETDQPLPVFGESDIAFRQGPDGTQIADTLDYTIPKFSFTNQDGKTVSHRDYSNSIFVADFFFTECPSICPILSSQMARLQALVQKEGLQKDVKFLSHSVKPDHDTPEILKQYGEHLGADFSNWNFVTGKAEDIYEQAQYGYMLTAFPSDTAAGGVFHTDKLTLVDYRFRIRGYYDGTSTKSVDQLFSDIHKLVKEQKSYVKPVHEKE